MIGTRTLSLYGMFLRTNCAPPQEPVVAHVDDDRVVGHDVEQVSDRAVDPIGRLELVLVELPHAHAHQDPRIIEALRVLWVVRIGGLERRRLGERTREPPMSRLSGMAGACGAVNV